jgi:transposase InsO family protein
MIQEQQQQHPPQQNPDDPNARTTQSQSPTQPPAPPSINECCEAYGVSRSGYYDHLKKPARPRVRQDEAIATEIEKAFSASRRSYGTRRIRAAVGRKGHRVGRKRIARLMKAKRLKARQKGRFRPQTTNSQHKGPIAPNLLLEQAAPTKPNEVWVTDITYIQTTEGWIYLSATLDLYTRRAIAWQLSESLATPLCSGTLQKALESERPETTSLIHHSDRGVQYASIEFRHQLDLSRITQSMSRKGNCYDNAAMESFWSSYKTDCLQDYAQERKLPTPAQLELLTFEYMEITYNNKRLHSSLDYLTPAEFEAKYRTTIDN